MVSEAYSPMPTVARGRRPGGVAAAVLPAALTQYRRRGKRGVQGATGVPDHTQDQQQAKDAALRNMFKPHHAVSVPKNVNLEVAFDVGSKPVTTAMLRNIPNRYTQATLLQEIECSGFQGTYDFFYLPMDTHNRTSVGYAFINFLRPADMARFSQVFSGYKFRDHSSQKMARVSPAHIQGLVDNVHHFVNRAVTHSRNCQYRPLVIYQGKHMDLGEACEAFRQARRCGYLPGTADADTATDGYSECTTEASSQDHGVPDYMHMYPPAMNPTVGMDPYAMQPPYHCSPDSFFEDERYMVPMDWSFDSYVDPYSPWLMGSAQYDDGQAGKNHTEDLKAWLTPPEPETRSAPQDISRHPLTDMHNISLIGERDPHFEASDIHDSFSNAKKGIEEAVSKWLRQECEKDAVSSNSSDGTGETPR